MTIEPPSPFETALLITLVILPIIDLISTGFLGWLWFRSRTYDGGSWLLALLTTTSGIVTVNYLWFGFLAARRLAGFMPLDGTAPISALFLLLLGTVPFVKAVAFWRTRRRRRNYTPPPFDGND